MSSRENSRRKDVGNSIMGSFLGTSCRWSLGLRAAAIQAALWSPQSQLLEGEATPWQRWVSHEWHRGQRWWHCVSHETRDTERGRYITVNKSQVRTCKKYMGLLWSALSTCWVWDRLNWTFRPKQQTRLSGLHALHVSVNGACVYALFQRGFKVGKKLFQQNMLLLQSLHGWPFMVDVGGIKTWLPNVWGARCQGGSSLHLEYLEELEGKARVEVLHYLRSPGDLLPGEGGLCLAIHQGKGGHCVRRISGNGFHTGSSEPQGCSGQGPQGSFLGARTRLSYDVLLRSYLQQSCFYFSLEGGDRQTFSRHFDPFYGEKIYIT